MNLYAWCTSFIFIVSVALKVSSALPSHQACAWDEYYDENTDNCGPCREICVNMEVTRTEEQCHEQCPEYLENNPPGRLIDGNPPKKGVTVKDSQLPSSSPHPGIITAIVLGVLCLGGVMGAASLLYWRFKSRSQNYHPAPRNDGDADGRGDGADVRGDDGHNDEVRVQMEELRSAVHVSSEDVEQLSSASAEVLNDRQEDVSRVHTQHQSGVKYGIPECDPLAPSSAAYRYVMETETVL